MALFFNARAPFHRLAFGIEVNHRWPIKLVYASTAALWLYFALTPHVKPIWDQLQLSCTNDSIPTLALAALSVAVTAAIIWLANWSFVRSKKRWKQAVQNAMYNLLARPPAMSYEHIAEALCKDLAGNEDDRNKYVKRLAFYSCAAADPWFGVAAGWTPIRSIEKSALPSFWHKPSISPRARSSTSTLSDVEFVLPRAQAEAIRAPDVAPEKIADRYPRSLANLRRAIAVPPFVWVYDNSDLGNPFRKVAEFEHGERKEYPPRPEWLKK